MHDNIVVFKGRKDGIVILLNEDVDFVTLKKGLRSKTGDAKKFFSGAKMSITFQGRALSETEASELLDIIIQEADLNVSFVKDQIEAVPRVPKPLVSLLPEIDPSEHMLTIHRGSLRSGKSVRYAGSVLILGDVNHGAEVVADGHVVVLGAVKGMVHAGFGGSHECFVSALHLLPVQLRIAEIVTYIPDEIMRQNKKNPIPSYAYINDGQIYIEPLL